MPEVAHYDLHASVGGAGLNVRVARFFSAQEQPSYLHEDLLSLATIELSRLTESNF